MRVIPFLLVLASSANAQSESPTFVVDLFDMTATYSAPPWITSETGLDEVEVSRQNGVSPNNTRVFILEYIPRGESFDNWSQLYAIHAETPLSGSVDGYMGGIYSRVQEACDGAFIQSSQTTPENVNISIVYCPNYVGDPTTGEIAYFNLQMRGDVLVRNYYHRRVPAYDLQENFPVTREELMQDLLMIDALSLN